MQKMSGTDLGFVLSELAPLAGKRIARIRKTPDGIFIFKIGNEELLFQPGVRMHLTRQAMQATEAPDGFVAFLRKNIEGKTAQIIEQRQGERIVEITTRSKERLIFELFRKGNIALVGEGGVIAACLQRDEAGGRRVARGEKYVYPKATPYAKILPEKVAFVVKENDKGGPVGFSTDAAQAGRQFASFSDALDYYYANQKEESSAQKATSEKMGKLLERLKSQQESLSSMEKQRLEVQKAADEISRNFENVEGLLSLIRKLKKGGAGEEEINRQVAAHKAKVSGAEVEVDL
jgi:predicted ribosome quality control (RQC) complex YloA/Tae2 family protein